MPAMPAPGGRGVSGVRRELGGVGGGLWQSEAGDRELPDAGRILSAVCAADSQRAELEVHAGLLPHRNRVGVCGWRVHDGPGEGMGSGKGSRKQTVRDYLRVPGDSAVGVHAQGGGGGEVQALQ